MTENSKNALGSMQQIERDILGTKNKTAIEALKTEAATKGWSTNLGNAQTAAGTASTKFGQIATASGSIASNTEKSAVRSERMADGTIRIWQESAKVDTAWGQVAGSVGEANTDLSTSAVSIGSIRDSSGTVATELNKAATDADGLATSSSSIQESLGEVDTETLAGDLNDASTAAGGLAESSGEVEQNLENLPDLAQPAQDMTSIATDADSIANSDMAGVVGDMSSSCSDIASSMGTAAGKAGDFYDAMNKAAGIPCNKWMGGDVSAGSRYTVNEMGQEAFRSRSGRLSLINKPAWGQWRAPSDGVVIPAGMTAQLREDGAFDRSPGRSFGGGTGGQKDQLPTVIGKLQKSVDDLVAKDWNVQVRVRNSEGSSALSVLNKMRT